MTEAYAVSERYKDVTQTKADGITYTPRELANFVASRIVENAKHTTRVPLRILDPAVGHGELLIALLDKLSCPVEVYGFETDHEALAEARTRLTGAFPMVELHLQLGSFLEHVLDDHSAGLFGNAAPYDLIIAKSSLCANTGYGRGSGTAPRVAVWAFGSRRPLPRIPLG